MSYITSVKTSSKKKKSKYTFNPWGSKKNGQLMFIQFFDGNCQEHNDSTVHQMSWYLYCHFGIGDEFSHRLREFQRSWVTEKSRDIMSNRLHWAATIASNNGLLCRHCFQGNNAEVFVLWKSNKRTYMKWV